MFIPKTIFVAHAVQFHVMLVTEGNGVFVARLQLSAAPTNNHQMVGFGWVLAD
jgi:hypothetical protein|tara:strand:+ start:349 stop:507 length:159 start_codon:yes stop_codon:yes gene_type:complete